MQKNAPLPDLWTIEREYLSQGCRLLCGVDEAGAGPLAGDVYAAAVILPEGFQPDGLNDSKKVTPKRRELLFEQIKEGAIAWSIGTATAAEIDELDILNCRMLAMNRAIAGLEPQPEFALVDGNRDHGSKISIELPCRCVVKGDSRSASIAAASILAKVSRDYYMVELAKVYPQYRFEQHKGYGTKLHYEMLAKYGPCPIHRRSFLKKRHEK